MSMSDPLLAAIRWAASVETMMREASLDENERWIAHHVIDRFGEKKGFKLTPLHDKNAFSCITKLIAVGMLELQDGTEDNFLWTDKWREIGK